MNDKLNEEAFTAAMEKAVEMRGADYVYPQDRPGWMTTGSRVSCVYSTPEGAPACIVGQALSLIDPELVPSYQDSHDGCDMDAMSVLTRLLGVSYETPHWVYAAYLAQILQDQGGTWGAALDKYLNHLEREV